MKKRQLTASTSPPSDSIDKTFSINKYTSIEWKFTYPFEDNKINIFPKNYPRTNFTKSKSFSKT